VKKLVLLAVGIGLVFVAWGSFPGYAGGEMNCKKTCARIVVPAVEQRIPLAPEYLSCRQPLAPENIFKQPLCPEVSCHRPPLAPETLARYPLVPDRLCRGIPLAPEALVTLPLAPEWMCGPICITQPGPAPRACPQPVSRQAQGQRGAMERRPAQAPK
jgi:hypothetical protein